MARLIQRALVIVLLLTAGIGARDCGIGSPLDWQPTEPPTSAASGGETCGWRAWSLTCDCGWHQWACNVSSNLIPPPKGFTAPACGLLLCAASAAAAAEDVATNLLGGHASDYPELVCLDAGADLMQASTLDANAFAAGPCVTPKGPPCVPLITTPALLLPSPPLCDLAPTDPSRVCCPSPQTGVPYLCRPLPIPSSMPGKGLCVIDTVNDPISDCVESTQCYPGFCWQTACVCAQIGDNCAASVHCCDYPQGGACVGGVCAVAN